MVVSKHLYKAVAEDRVYGMYTGAVYTSLKKAPFLYRHSRRHGFYDAKKGNTSWHYVWRPLPAKKQAECAAGVLHFTPLYAPTGMIQL